MEISATPDGKGNRLCYGKPQNPTMLYTGKDRSMTYPKKGVPKKDPFFSTISPLIVSLFLLGVSSHSALHPLPSPLNCTFCISGNSGEVLEEEGFPSPLYQIPSPGLFFRFQPTLPPVPILYLAPKESPPFFL
jgi:hypothetical protein